MKTTQTTKDKTRNENNTNNKQFCKTNKQH